MEPGEYWLHEFDYQSKDVLHRLEVQSALGQSALKSLMLVNGGAIIGLLTFVGNNGTLASPICLKWGMACYGAGLFVGLLAYFGAYFSQGDFMQHAAYRVVNAQSRMVGNDTIELPPIHEKRGTIFLYSAIGCVLLSLILFGVGSALSLNGIL